MSVNPLQIWNELIATCARLGTLRDAWRLLGQRLMIAMAMTAALGAGIATAYAQPKPETLKLVREHRGKTIEVTGELSLPPGAGKVPVMLIHHGSGGVSPHREHRYAREMLAMGVGALVIDSFTARGVKSTVTDQAAVTTLEMAGDAYAALKTLAAHPRVDAARIGIVGFSKGGSVALLTARERLASRTLPGGPRFALHVPFYPACGNHFLNAASTGAPILMFIGGADTYAGVAPCTEYADKLKTAGARVEVRIFPGAPHGFDGAAAYSNPKGENHSRCIFDEQADGSWKERTSGVVTTDTRGQRIQAAHGKALAACRSYGVSGGPDSAAAQASLADLKAAVRRHLVRQ